MEFNLIYRALHREMASNFALLGGKIMLPCNNQVAPIIASAHALQATFLFTVLLLIIINMYKKVHPTSSSTSS